MSPRFYGDGILTDQGRSDQHAYPGAGGLRCHRGDLSDCDLVDPVWLLSHAQELADLS